MSGTVEDLSGCRGPVGILSGFTAQIAPPMQCRSGGSAVDLGVICMDLLVVSVDLVFLGMETCRIP